MEHPPESDIKMWDTRQIKKQGCGTPLGVRNKDVRYQAELDARCWTSRGVRYKDVRQQDDPDTRVRDTEESETKIWDIRWIHMQRRGTPCGVRYKDVGHQAGSDTRMWDTLRSELQRFWDTGQIQIKGCGTPCRVRCKDVGTWTIWSLQLSLADWDWLT